MSRWMVLVAAFFLFAVAPRADACVGRMLYIGVLDAADQQVLAEILSVLISERTGTAVHTKQYRDTKELYEAVKKGEVSIFMENTEHAMRFLGKGKESDSKQAYHISKEEFRKRLNLVVLDPVGFLMTPHGGGAYFAPVITVAVLENFPALPRVINKLSGVVNDETFEKLIASSKSGVKPRKAARDFLKARKLI